MAGALCLPWTRERTSSQHSILWVLLAISFVFNLQLKRLATQKIGVFHTRGGWGKYWELWVVLRTEGWCGSWVGGDFREGWASWEGRPCLRSGWQLWRRGLAFKSGCGGWRQGSAGRSMCCSFRGPELSSHYPRLAAHGHLQAQLQGHPSSPTSEVTACMCTPLTDTHKNLKCPLSNSESMCSHSSLY